MLYFKPWIGVNFEDSKDKLLLIGESHYDKTGEANENFTIDLIEELLDGANYPYFNKICGILNTGKHIWHDIAFSNLIQRPFSNAKSQPTASDIEQLKLTFPKILNIIKPKKIIVLSKRLWCCWLPEENCSLTSRVSSGKQHSNVWDYHYDDGICQAIGICHPSWMFGKNGTVSQWSVVIEKFLNLNEYT